MRIDATNPLVDEVLKDRYQTLHKVALQMGRDPDQSDLARWLPNARTETEAYQGEQKSKRRVDEAKGVAEAYELASGLLLAFIAAPEDDA